MEHRSKKSDRPLKLFRWQKRRPNPPEDLWQRVENSYLRKLKTGNIVHKGSAIPSPIGMLFRNILVPSSSEMGSMLKDPSPTFSSSPKTATVEGKPAGTDNRKSRKPIAKARLMPGPTADIIMLSSSGSTVPRPVSYP